MTARTFEVDEPTPLGRGGPGVRVSGETLLAYDLAVIASDVDDVVDAAGAWLCDRVRAGWQVTALVPAGSDIRALTILGVAAEEHASGIDALRDLSPAAIAVGANVLRDDEQMRREVLRTIDAGTVEVTVWGESGLFTGDRRFSRVRHRPSAAAKAFKGRALLAAGHPPSAPAVEEFVSSALWYPLDGTDLAPYPG